MFSFHHCYYNITNIILDWVLIGSSPKNNIASRFKENMGFGIKKLWLGWFLVEMVPVPELMTIPKHSGKFGYTNQHHQDFIVNPNYNWTSVFIGSIGFGTLIVT